MSEFAPVWRRARMTRAQVRKYIKDLEKKREIAKAKLDEAKARWEFSSEEKELYELEKKLEKL